MKNLKLVKEELVAEVVGYVYDSKEDIVEEVNKVLDLEPVKTNEDDSTLNIHYVSTELGMLLITIEVEEEKNEEYTADSLEMCTDDDGEVKFY